MQGSVWNCVPCQYTVLEVPTIPQLAQKPYYLHRLVAIQPQFGIWKSELLNYNILYIGGVFFWHFFCPGSWWLRGFCGFYGPGSWWLLVAPVAPGGSWWLPWLPWLPWLLVASGGSWWLLWLLWLLRLLWLLWLLWLLAPVAHLSSIDQSINEACSPGACCALDTHPSISNSNSNSIYIYLYLSTYLPIYLSIYPSIYLSIHLCIYLSIYLSI